MGRMRKGKKWIKMIFSLWLQWCRSRFDNSIEFLRIRDESPISKGRSAFYQHFHFYKFVEICQNKRAAVGFEAERKMTRSTTHRSFIGFGMLENLQTKRFNPIEISKSGHHNMNRYEPIWTDMKWNHTILIKKNCNIFMHETVDIHLTSTQPKDYTIFYESNLFHNKTITATGPTLRLAIQLAVRFIFRDKYWTKPLNPYSFGVSFCFFYFFVFIFFKLNVRRFKVMGIYKTWIAYVIWIQMHTE